MELFTASGAINLVTHPGSVRYGSSELWDQPVPLRMGDSEVTQWDDRRWEGALSTPVFISALDAAARIRPQDELDSGDIPATFFCIKFIVTEVPFPSPLSPARHGLSLSGQTQTET